MAIQQITKKRIIKHDTNNPNYKAEPVETKPVPEVNGNTINNNTKGVYQSEDTSVYGEKMETMMKAMMGKIDNIKVKNGNLNVYDENTAVDIDVKRNVFLYKADDSNVKIDNVKKGKVNNKLDKLRALRRNGN